MTALRFQTGGRHQTSPASLRDMCKTAIKIWIILNIFGHNGCLQNVWFIIHCIIEPAQLSAVNKWTSKTFITQRNNKDDIFYSWWASINMTKSELQHQKNKWKRQIDEITFGETTLMSSLRNLNFPISWWNVLPQFLTQASRVFNKKRKSHEQCSILYVYT